MKSTNRNLFAGMAALLVGFALVAPEAVFSADPKFPGPRDPATFPRDIHRYGIGPRPDLSILISLSHFPPPTAVSPATVKQGEFITVKGAVLNVGKATAPAHEIGIYLRKANETVSGNPPATKGTLVSMVPGSEYVPKTGNWLGGSPDGVSVKIPGNLATGLWNVEAWVDPNQAIYELSEKNNWVVLGTITVKEKAPHGFSPPMQGTDPVAIYERPLVNPESIFRGRRLDAGRSGTVFRQPAPVMNVPGVMVVPGAITPNQGAIRRGGNPGPVLRQNRPATMVAPPRNGGSQEILRESIDFRRLR